MVIEIYSYVLYQKQLYIFIDTPPLENSITDPFCLVGGRSVVAACLPTLLGEPKGPSSSVFTGKL